MQYRTAPGTIEVYAPDGERPLDDAIRLWRHIFGERQDLMQVFTGYRKVREKKCRLDMVAERYYAPDQLAEALAWAKQQASINRDAYFCVHQLTAPARIKENAASVRALWCETDGVDLAASPIKPTAVVESSPGHFHCYARLSHPIAPHVAEQLNRRWAKSFGADGSGFDLSQLLRVPGTRNFGYPDTPLVRLLEIDDETVYDPGEVDGILPKLPEPVAAGHVPTEALSDDDAELIGKMGRLNPVAGRLFAGNTSDYANEHGVVDPSSADWGLAQELVKACGGDLDRAERLMRESPLVRPKWDETRGDVSLLRYTLERAKKHPSAERSPALHFDDLGDETDAPGPPEGQCCGHLRQIAELKQRLADLQERFNWQDQFRRKKQIPAGDKVVGAALAELHATAEARGLTDRIPIVIEATRDLEAHPERATWADRTLTGRTGLSRSAATRSLERYTNETNGPWRLERDSFLTQDGLRRPRLFLVPKASAAETRAAVLEFEPPEAEPAKPKTPELIRCKKHPMARIEDRHTWRCQRCGRDAKPSTYQIIDPTDYEPPVLTDEQVTGEAEAGPAPGRGLWDLPAIQNDDLGIPAPLALSPVDNDARQNGELGPRYWPVYDRAPSTDMAPIANGHACHDCGAFSDDQWGPVVECGPPDRRVWLHAGADATCKMPMPLAVAS